MNCPCCGRPDLAPRIDRPGKHYDLKTGILPIHEWAGACGIGFISNARFGSGQVIKRTNRETSRRWRQLSTNPEQRSDK